jgi:hypothetical protein
MDAISNLDFLSKIKRRKVALNSKYDFAHVTCCNIECEKWLRR